MGDGAESVVQSSGAKEEREESDDQPHGVPRPTHDKLSATFRQGVRGVRDNPSRPIAAPNRRRHSIDRGIGEPEAVRNDERHHTSNCESRKARVTAVQEEGPKHFAIHRGSTFG